MQAQKTTKFSEDLFLTMGTSTRIIYDSLLLTKAQAEGIVNEADKAGINIAPKLSKMLPSYYSSLNVKTDKIKSTEVYYVRKSSSCDSCSKTCKGKCLIESAGSCLCLEVGVSTPGSLTATGPLLVVVLSDPAQQSQIFK